MKKKDHVGVVPFQAYNHPSGPVRIITEHTLRRWLAFAEDGSVLTSDRNRHRDELARDITRVLGKVLP